MKLSLACVACQKKTFTYWEGHLHQALVAGFALVLSAGAYAQTSGSISGQVADPSGASIPATTVTLKNVDTGSERTTVTTSSGVYSFTEVPIGRYVVSATHEGFKTSSTSEIGVQIGQAVRLDLHLEIGAISDTVEVSAAGALLQSENAATGTVIGNDEIVQLPLNNRNYLGLVALSSNVNTLSPASGQAGSRLGGDRANQSIAVGGQRIMFNYYTLDGVNNTDPDFNTYIGLPSPDSIQEMKVQTGVYSAEFGHEASQVNVVTKGGTNKYHGTAYEFIRNNYVDARPYWFPTRQPAGAIQQITPFKYNDFGFELDGPVRIPKIYNGKDKFFFMVSKEWYRSRSNNNNATATVPTAAMAAGNFSGYAYQYVDPSGGVHTQPVTIYDPATGAANGTGRQPFANNTIPASRIAPQTTALLKYLGTSATLPTYNCPTKVTTYTTCSAVPNYRYSTKSPSNRQSLYIRGDYNLSERTQLTFRYGLGDGDSISTGLLGAGSKTITQYQQYMGAVTHTFSPTVVNETRFGYSNFFNSLGLLSAYTTDVVSGLGIPGLSGGDPSTWGIPSMSFSNYSVSGVTSSGSFGTAPAIWTGFGDQGGDGPYVLRDPSWQIVDNVTLIHGKHSLRLGYEFNRQTFNQLGNQFSRGQFFVQPLNTSFYTGTTLTGGDALADLLLGNLQQSVVAVAVANANDVRNVQAGFVDDTYKVSPTFTASIGLRYEVTPPWTDTYGNNFNVRLPQMSKQGDTNTTYSAAQYPYYVRQGNCAPSDVYNGVSVRWTASRAECSNGQIPNDQLMNTRYTDIAPRLGLSWAPTEKTVLRLGYGIFYTQDVANAVFDISRNIAGRVTVTNQNASQIGAPSNLTWANAAPGASGSTIVNLPATTVAYANAVSHKTSYTQQFLLNLQQQFGKNWSVEAGYQGALSRHLYGFINANAATPWGYYGFTSATPVASRQPFPNVAGGLQYVHDGGSANYNSATFKVNRRFSNGISLTSSYTYSKSLDNTSGIRNQGNDQLYPQNSYCLACEYGPSAFDTRNRIVVAGLYELPIGRGKLIALNNRALISLLGGWQVGGIFTHQTGQPGTPLVGSDNAGIASPFGNFDRPNATGASAYLTGATRSVDHWANLAAYVKSPAGTFGNVSRGSFTGPGMTNLDASIHKDFAMPYSEHHLLSIRFEAFNALNHPNWSNPNLTINSSTFGQVNAGSMRQLQLAAKYNF